MRDRYLSLFGASGVVAATIMLSPTAMSALPQDNTRPASNGLAIPNTSTVPRTADGHPDLQGVWNFDTTIPLERPDATRPIPEPPASRDATSLIIDPADGKLPPLTPEGLRRRVAEAETLNRPPTTPADRYLAERCILGF